MLTLDYELFFGRRTGTVEACMLEPTRHIADLVEKHGGRLTLFVDAGYLVKLNELTEHAGHRRSSASVCEQLSDLARRGHDVQLHTHPHWVDSHWTDDHWVLDTARYKLHAFDEPTRCEIVRTQAQTLAEITGVDPIAYRAGGWCMQPFTDIRAALTAAGIRIDSTVYARGVSANPGREFDFSAAPDTDYWRFAHDPLKPDAAGEFVEVPITAVATSPWFYWRTAARRLLAGQADKPFGDGEAMSGSATYYRKKLTQWEYSVASVDGERAGLLGKALRTTRARGGEVVNAMGHPKALTRRSLARLDVFLEQQRDGLEFHTIASFARATSL